MNTIEHFVDLFNYTYWANRRVWDCAIQTTDEDYFKDQTFSIGSIYNQLRHTMGVEEWWLKFLVTGEVVFHTDEEKKALKDRHLLRQRWDSVHAHNIAYIQSLTSDDLTREVKPPFWDDDEPPVTVAQALTQVVNHSTNHRAQTMAVLHIMGYEGVGQDFLTYLDEKE